MMASRSLTAPAVLLAALGPAALGLAAPVSAAEICKGFGPQTPRDIASVEGTNARTFTLAPPPAELNLCNIHAHANAEHKAPASPSSPARASMAATSATKPIR